MSHTILVVDDEADVRAFLSAVLEKRGYRVVTAADGKQAYSIADGKKMNRDAHDQGEAAHLRSGGHDLARSKSADIFLQQNPERRHVQCR